MTSPKAADTVRQRWIVSTVTGVDGALTHTLPNGCDQVRNSGSGIIRSRMGICQCRPATEHSLNDGLECTEEARVLKKACNRRKDTTGAYFYSWKAIEY